MERRFAAILEEDFALPAATVLDALEGEPQRQAIRICAWANRQDDPAHALLCWATKHRRGHHRRCGRGQGRPRTNTRCHGRGTDIAAPRDIPPGAPRGYGLDAGAILRALERMAR